MDAKEEFSRIAASGETDTLTACQVFDGLEIVKLEELLGTWKGREIRTGHPLDGTLEKLRWFGKSFHDAENVDPLLFELPGGKVIAVDPAFVFDKLKLKEISGGKARMRYVEYRGKVSAAMIYDNLPIIDHFRKVKDGVLLGMMDWKGDQKPYFFIMEKVETVQKA